MKKYVIGIDGGGTKTHCMLFDIEGEFVDLIKAGTFGYEYLSHGYISLGKRMNKIVNSILERNSIQKKNIVSCAIGLSGIDTNYQKKCIAKIMDQIGFTRYILCNDAYLGIKAMSGKGFGICAINGTGYSVVGIDPEENTFQIGGSYELSGDFGGGRVMGKVVAAKTYESLYKIKRKTILQEMMFDLLKINDKCDYLDALIRKTENGDILIKDLVKLVFSAADKNDGLALEILSGMGQDYGRAINAIIRELNYKNCSEIPIVLAGSLFIKGSNKLAIEELTRIVKNANTDKKIEISVLNLHPVCGAIIWALNNYYKDNRYFEKIVSDVNWNKVFNNIKMKG
ncbi:MAG: BadF/BadG/BcrA/BcrD ATPase family protein [Candidatus Humimicrobiaceae bacterium]